MIAWSLSLFTNPIELAASAQLTLLLPLCAAVAIIYKTVRVEHISQLPLKAALVFLYIIVGLAFLAGLLGLIVVYWS